MLVHHLTGIPMGMTGDGDDFGVGGACLGQPGDRRAAQIVESQPGNSKGLQGGPPRRPEPIARPRLVVGVGQDRRTPAGNTCEFVLEGTANRDEKPSARLGLEERPGQRQGGAAPRGVARLPPVGASPTVEEHAHRKGRPRPPRDGR